MSNFEEIWNTNLQSLTQRAANNDEGAITALYNHYEKPMIRYARNYVSNNEDAQDAVQNAFINAFRHISSLEDGSKFEAWLRRIVRNEATSLVRGKLQNSTTYFTDMEDEEGNMQYDPSDEKIESRPDLVLDQQTTKELIVKILDSLPEEQRLVTMMYYYEHLTMKDIAEELDIPQSTVVGRINTAKKNIKTSVLSLEKTDGIKLYSLTPLTFFLYLLSLLGQTDPASIPMRVPTSISGSTRPAGHGIKTILESIKETSTVKPVTPAVHTVTSSSNNGVEGVLSALRENRTAVNTAETAAKAAAAKAVTHTAAKAAGTAITGKILPIILGVAVGVAAVFGGGYLYKTYAERRDITSGSSSQKDETAGQNTDDEISDDKSGFSQDNEGIGISEDEKNVIWHVEPSLEIVKTYQLSMAGIGIGGSVYGYPQEWNNSGYTNNAIEVIVKKQNDASSTEEYYGGVYNYEGIPLLLPDKYDSDPKNSVYPGIVFIDYGYGDMEGNGGFRYFNYDENHNLCFYYFSKDFKSIEKKHVLRGDEHHDSVYVSYRYSSQYDVVLNGSLGVAKYSSGDPTSPNPSFNFEPGIADQLSEYQAILEINDSGRGIGFAVVNNAGKILYSSNKRILSNYGCPHFVNGYFIESSQPCIGFTDEYKYSYEGTQDPYVGGPYSVVRASDGKHITDYIYEDVKFFEDGYCPVKKNGKWGFIDEQGNEVTDFIWDDVSTLYKGYAYVGINGIYGVIDLKETLSRNIPVTEETCYKQFGGVTELKATDIPEPVPTESSVITATDTNPVIGKVRIKVTNLNSRSIPSTSGTKLPKVKNGTEYDVYEIAYGEGYTWYRIEENRWIADDSGKWVEYTSN